SFGSTKLVQVGNNYYLNSISTGTGPSFKYNGTAIVTGQFGAWNPIGAEQTATGYVVAWKVSGQDQYTIWNTDTNGNFVSAAFSGAVSGASTTLESFETTFHQAVNGDGTIGINRASLPAAANRAPDNAAAAHLDFAVVTVLARGSGLAGFRICNSTSEA